MSRPLGFAMILVSFIVITVTPALLLVALAPATAPAASQIGGLVGLPAAAATFWVYDRWANKDDR